MIRVYDFNERLKFSQGQRCESDLETIKEILDGCVSVEPASQELDKLGVDYIATLRRGAEVYIDAKTRSVGCSRFWGNEPELAIEKWSIIPTDQQPGKVGWSLDEAKITDMILYTFAPQDTKQVYLFPFQSLRMAARRNLSRWAKKHKVDIQNSGRWKSEAVFVPASEVITAVMKTISYEQSEDKQ